MAPVRVDYEINGHRRRHKSKRDSLSPSFLEDRRCEDTVVVVSADSKRRRHHSSGVSREVKSLEDELDRKDKKLNELMIQFKQVQALASYQGEEIKKLTTERDYYKDRVDPIEKQVELQAERRFQRKMVQLKQSYQEGNFVYAEELDRLRKEVDKKNRIILKQTKLLEQNKLADLMDVELNEAVADALGRPKIEADRKRSRPIIRPPTPDATDDSDLPTTYQQSSSTNQRRPKKVANRSGGESGRLSPVHMDVKPQINRQLHQYNQGTPNEPLEVIELSSDDDEAVASKKSNNIQEKEQEKQAIYYDEDDEILWYSGEDEPSNGKEKNVQEQNAPVNDVPNPTVTETPAENPTVTETPAANPTVTETPATKLPPANPPPATKISIPKTAAARALLAKTSSKKSSAPKSPETNQGTTAQDAFDFGFVTKQMLNQVSSGKTVPGSSTTANPTQTSSKRLSEDNDADDEDEAMEVDTHASKQQQHDEDLLSGPVIPDEMMLTEEDEKELLEGKGGQISFG